MSHRFHGMLSPERVKFPQYAAIFAYTVTCCCYLYALTNPPPAVPVPIRAFGMFGFILSLLLLVWASRGSAIPAAFTAFIACIWIGADYLFPSAHFPFATYEVVLMGPLIGLNAVAFGYRAEAQR